MRKTILASLILLTACNEPLVYEKEISTVDSLAVELNMLDRKLDSIDLTAVREIAKESKNLHDYLVANYPDSADRDFWVNKMDPLYGVQRGLSKFLSQESQLNEEINYTRKQLTTLKNSLRDEKLTEEEVKKYLQQEFEALEEISFMFNKVSFKAKGSLQKWELHEEEMKAVADSLKKL